MKSLGILKALAILIVAIYVISRGLSEYRSKHSGSSSSVAPTTLTGTVQKVLKDRRLNYVLIEGPGGSHWIGCQSAAPEVGQHVSCRVERFVDAFESKSLNMAFERVYFTDDLTVI